MPVLFKNKLSRCEIAPPAGIWDRISDELDKVFVPSDSPIASKVENISVRPPDAAWTEIESFLDNERTPLKQGWVTPMLFKRITIAAMFAAVVAVSIMYLFTGGRTNSEIESAVIGKTNLDIKTDVSNILPTPSPATEIAVKSLTAHTRLIPNRQPLFAQPAGAASGMESEILDRMNDPHLTSVRTVKAEQRVSVPAPSIRDANGNIILDVNLISKPNDPYITVTGPNGCQTKISSKFVNCLSYLNGDISFDGANNDGVIWKDRFQSWRDRLLNQDSFIPAANNFFDIFEMKDIIQE